MISNLNTDGSAVSMAHGQKCVGDVREMRSVPASPAIAPFGPGVWAASSSDPAKAPYKVERLSDGTLRCSCEGNATWGRECRHIKAVRASLPAPAPAPVTFTCVECGLWPARQDDVICRHCRDAQDAAAMAAIPVDEADMPVEATPIYRETLLSVCYAAPEGGSTDALHGAIAEGRARHEAARSRERHAKALAAPVGTFTLLAGPQFGLGE